MIDLATQNDSKCLHILGTVHQYYNLSGYLSPPTRMPPLSALRTKQASTLRSYALVLLLVGFNPAKVEMKIRNLHPKRWRLHLNNNYKWTKAEMTPGRKKPTTIPEVALKHPLKGLSIREPPSRLVTKTERSPPVAEM